MQNGCNEGGARLPLFSPVIYDVSSAASHTGWSVLGNASEQDGHGAAKLRPKSSSPRDTLPSMTLNSQSQPETDFLIEKGAKQGKGLSLLRDSAKVLMRRYGKLAPMREEGLSLHSWLEHERQTLIHYRRYVSESQHEFLGACDALADSEIPVASRTQLQAFRRQMMDDVKRLSDHAQKIRDLEVKLSNLQFALQQKERGLAQAGQKMLDVLHGMDLAGQDDSRAMSHTSSEVSQTEPPVLIQHYFDKAGDVKIERERLLYLDIEYREERARRMLQQDQDLPLTVSDQEFEDGHLRACAELEVVVAEAVKKAELAKAVCVSEGLDPESYLKSTSEQDATSSILSGKVTGETPNTMLADDTWDMEEQLAHPFHSFLPQPVLPVSNGSFEPWIRPHDEDSEAPTSRVRDWIDTLSEDDESIRPRSATRSVSECGLTAQALETAEDGTLGFNEAFSRSRKYLQQGSLASYVTVTGPENTAERPVLTKRSSSDSQMLILPTSSASREDTIADLRASAAGSQ